MVSAPNHAAVESIRAPSSAPLHTQPLSPLTARMATMGGNSESKQGRECAESCKAIFEDQLILNMRRLVGYHIDKLGSLGMTSVFWTGGARTQRHVDGLCSKS